MMRGSIGILCGDCSLLLLLSYSVAFANGMIPSKLPTFVIDVLPSSWALLSSFSHPANMVGYSCIKLRASIPDRKPIVQYVTIISGRAESLSDTLDSSDGRIFVLNSPKETAPDIMDTSRSESVRTSTSNTLWPWNLHLGWIVLLVDDVVGVDDGNNESSRSSREEIPATSEKRDW